MGQEQSISRELTELSTRVTEWRKGGGGRGSRIPEELWQEAVRVAGNCGLYATAKALHFSYDGLKERSQQGAGNGAIAEKGLGEVVRSEGGLRSEVRSIGSARSVVANGRTDAGPRFVALAMTPSRAGSATTIELTGRTGDRMRVEMSGDIDVASLVQAFLSRQS